MKKVFNVTIAVEVESEKDIESLNDIDFEVSVKSKDADVSLLFLVESYKV